MADIHVLGGNKVAMHFAVPDENNPAGVPWSVALINSGQGGRTVLLEADGTAGRITAVEKAAIEAGTVFERVVILDLEGVGQTAAGRLAVLQNHHAITLAALTAELLSSLRHFGQVEEARF